MAVITIKIHMTDVFATTEDRGISDRHPLASQCVIREEKCALSGSPELMCHFMVFWSRSHPAANNQATLSP